MPRRRHLGTGFGFGALLPLALVSLLALPSMGAAPSIKMTWRAPYSAAQGFTYISGAQAYNCAGVSNVPTPVFNLTTGRAIIKNESVSLVANRLCNGKADLDEYAEAGIQNLSYTPAKSGSITFNATWSGPVWLNLSVSYPGGVGYPIIASAAVYECTGINSSSPFAVDQVASVSLEHNGSKAVRVGLAAMPLDLTTVVAGQNYRLFAYVILAVEVHFGRRVHAGSGSASISTSTLGVKLDKIE